MDGETEFVNLVSYVPIEPRVDRDPKMAVMVNVPPQPAE
jgi:hypothetical protein